MTIRGKLALIVKSWRQILSFSPVKLVTRAPLLLRLPQHREKRFSYGLRINYLNQKLKKYPNKSDITIRRTLNK